MSETAFALWVMLPAACLATLIGAAGLAWRPERYAIWNALFWGGFLLACVVANLHR